MIEKYENGDWEEFELVNGVKQGKAIYHYSENNLKQRKCEEYNYINGIKQGKAILYWNGRYSGDYEERNYVDGLVQGEATYYKKGFYSRTRTYIDGLLAQKVESRYGYELVVTVNEKKEGKAIYNYFSGEKSIRYYKNGELNGKCIDYYADGKVKCKCSYKNSFFNDEYISYYNNGKIERKCFYKNTKLDGEDICYYKNGVLNYKKIYKNGRVCEGEYLTYNEDGSIWNKEEYDFNGVLRLEEQNYINEIPLFVYEYDNRGKEIKKITNSKYGDTLKTSIKYDYQKSGKHVVAWKEAHYENKILTKIEYYYKAVPESECFYDETDPKVIKTQYFDKNGDVLDEITYQPSIIEKFFEKVTIENIKDGLISLNKLIEKYK